MRRYLSAALRWARRIPPFVPVLLGRRGTDAQPVHAAVTREAQSVDAPPPPERRGERPLTVFSIIRNGVRNGYPFVESYASWLPYCDRVFVLEGESDDGTQDALAALAEIDDRFTWASAPWPTTAAGGAAIADFTNACLSHVKGSGGNLMYAQADEVYTVSQRVDMRDWEGGVVQFQGCINFWNGFDRVLANDFPMRYIRLLPDRGEVRSIGDGFSFEFGDEQVEKRPDEILHYGWCFPVNVLQKHVSHSKIYRDDLDYRVRGFLSRRMLRDAQVRLASAGCDRAELRRGAVPGRAPRVHAPPDGDGRVRPAGRARAAARRRAW